MEIKPFDMEEVFGRGRLLSRRLGGFEYRSLYFDTRGLDLAGEKWASDFYKTKVRLRWYDGRGAVFLEVKRRTGGRRPKLRSRLPLDAAELESAGLAGVSRWGIREALAQLDPQAPTELEPALRLGYLRERFVEPASASRLNLDSELIALEVAPWCRDVGCGGELGNLLELAVVELKGEFRELPLLLGALHGLGARRGSLSKYTACMTTDA